MVRTGSVKGSEDQWAQEVDGPYFEPWSPHLTNWGVFCKSSSILEFNTYFLTSVFHLRNGGNKVLKVNLFIIIINIMVEHQRKKSTVFMKNFLIWNQTDPVQISHLMFNNSVPGASPFSFFIQR